MSYFSKLKNKRFILLSILIEFLFLLFYLINPIKRYLGGDSLVAQDDNIFYVATGLLLLLAGLYIYVYKKEVSSGKIDKKYIWFFFLLFNFSLFFLWPVASHDIFCYIAQSRVVSVWSENPYLVEYNSLHNDLFYDLLTHNWLKYPSAYGPVFLGIGTIFSSIWINSLTLTLFAFKFIFITANILSFYLIDKIFDNNKALYLYAYNPLLIFEFVINGHNDILYILFILISLFFVIKKKNNLLNSTLALVFLTMSVLVKATSIIFLPLAFFILFLRTTKIKQKIIFTIVSSLAMIATIFLAYLPFWEGWSIFFVLSNVPGLIFFLPGFGIAFFILLFEYIFNNPSVGEIALFCGRVVFIIFYIFILAEIFLKSKKKPNIDIIRYYLITCCLFLFFIVGWLMPWYFSILIILCIGYMAERNKFYISPIGAITIYALCYYFVLR